ncbi:hypothetical protein E4U25_005314 [Claviceps purpurea]|nr:hypothetical protein E4U25_005314 [Claviceps purpurea]
MAISTLLMIPIAAALFSTAQGQQFDGYISPHELLGLSDGCFAAVNTTISSCPAWLPGHAGFEGPSMEILPSEQLTVLCESSCKRDLESLRTSILRACTASYDVMVPAKVAYPATFIVDRFLYAVDLSCLKETASGKYCDAVVADWAGLPWTMAQKCSQCELGVQQLQLASPFGFNEDSAREFADTTMNCSAGDYKFATPTSYALNATTFPSQPPACTGMVYTMTQGDTCVNISGARGMSTFQVITMNKLNLGCDNLPAVGETLCLPAESTCRTHQLELYESCQTLMAIWNATLAQVLAWNPMIDRFCSELGPWRGWYLCASSPSGTIAIGPGNTVTTPVPVPSNAQPQSNKRCGRWYDANVGDYCAAISLKFSVALSEFYFLNPQIDQSCSNLWANISYCVRPVGNIETYPGYTTTAPATTFTRPASTTSFVPSPIEFPPLLPRASGTIDDCFEYENAFDARSGLKDLAAGNACYSWSRIYDVTVEELIEWNPSLNATDSCVLQAGHSYCIRKWHTRPIVVLPHEYCTSPNRMLIPASSMQPSGCSCYTNFRAEDKANFNCSMVPHLLGITVTELTRLNPWIGPDCDTGFWSQLNADGRVQICVLASATPTTITNSTVPTTTRAAPPAPTQPGASKNCRQWHKVISGDGCWSIATAAGISLDQFYRMNTGVGSNCSALSLGYAVCVGE